MDKRAEEGLHAQTFSLSERVRIREALRRYARQHRLGAPALQRRIAQATGRIREFDSLDNPALVPRSTLQRFLRSEKPNTNDAMVVVYDEFVRQLGESEVKAFARAARTFYENSGMKTGLTMPAGQMKVLAGRGSAFSGDLWVEADGEEGAWSVRERVYNPFDVMKEPAEQHDTYEHYEGVLVRFEHYSVAFLRSMLTGYPREHWIYGQTPILHSHCMEGVFCPENTMPFRWTILELSSDDEEGDAT
jgi:hypothetical protein